MTDKKFRNTYKNLHVTEFKNIKRSNKNVATKKMTSIRHNDRRENIDRYIEIRIIIHHNEIKIYKAQMIMCITKK